MHVCVWRECGCVWVRVGACMCECGVECVCGVSVRVRPASHRHRAIELVLIARRDLQLGIKTTRALDTLIRQLVH